jgi:hypothetical protein
VRWQRLGQLAFSRPAAALYALVVAAAVAVVAIHPDLAPSYGQLFFTHSFSLIEVVLFLGQFPLMLVHEAAHALAGRRLGLRSRLRLGNRLYFLVLETTLDGLVSVPRSRRYLPMLAGMGADVLVVAVLTLVAAAFRGPDGALPFAVRVGLALGFTTLLRIVWQFYFYLQTDLYYLVCTVLGCVRLHRTARELLRNRVARLLRQPRWLVDEEAWHPADRRAARWYSWLLVLGYTATILVALFAILPTAYLFLSGVLGRFVHAASTAGLVDSTVFVALNTAQLVVIGWVALRARRRRAARTKHVID